MILQYSANNSGGDFWHTDEQWSQLLAAGWRQTSGLSCAKRFDSEQEGRDEWERIMQMDPTAQGCPCCGPPHNFYDYEEKAWLTWNPEWESILAEVDEEFTELFK